MAYLQFSGGFDAVTVQKCEEEYEHCSQQAGCVVRHISGKEWLNQVIRDGQSHDCICSRPNRNEKDVSRLHLVSP